MMPLALLHKYVAIHKMHELTFLYIDVAPHVGIAQKEAESQEVKGYC